MRGAKRILFFAEAVTLAHVARPIVLARVLNAASHEVVMACDSRYRQFLDPEPWQTLPLQSISRPQFLRALDSGSPVYNVETLRRYVKEDLKLIELVKPDLIVGDFRLSLSVSARLAGVPYAAITNAYWSPYYVSNEFPLPVLPLTRYLPVPVAKQLFRFAQPFAFSMHCKPLNCVRQENGLPSLGSSLRRVYTDADYALYGDVPVMFQTDQLPNNHRYLGAILWSPPAMLPAWWNDLPDDKPVIYLTLGSSGPPRLAQMVLNALADQPVTVMVSTAGANVTQRLPSNAYIADYLPGIQAAARSSIVVCNGGSPTSQQALVAGVPVLGIASNMDQFLNMRAIVEAGAGIVLRADRISDAGILEAVNQILVSSQLDAGARKLAEAFTSYNSSTIFTDFVAEVTGVVARPMSRDQHGNQI